MARCDVRKVPADPVVKGAKLDARIAHYVGIGRSARSRFFNEIGDDALLVVALQRDGLERHACLLAHSLAVCPILLPRALAARRVHLLVLEPDAQIEGTDLIHGGMYMYAC